MTRAGLSVMALLLWAGCSSGGGGGGGPFTPFDFALQRDGGATSCGGLGQLCCVGSACSGALACSAGRCGLASVDLGRGGTGGPNVAQFAIDHIAVPTQRSDHAFDLNGDARPDNQWGNIVGALTAQAFDVQSGTDAAVASGAALYLLELHTTDAALRNDPDLHVVLQAGDGSGGAPDFSGAGSFTVDGSIAPAEVSGLLQAGSFSSQDPVTTRSPATFPINLGALGLPFASGTVQAPLHGVHVSLTSVRGDSLSGELQGAIRKDDFDTMVMPAMAMQINDRVQADPTSSTSKMILSIFDSGNCTNPSGTSARASDGRIDPCEVTTNSLIMNVFAPDVQIYSDSTRGAGGKLVVGNTYGPQKANLVKDSLSIGLGFTAVSASF